MSKLNFSAVESGTVRATSFIINISICLIVMGTTTLFIKECVDGFKKKKKPALVEPDATVIITPFDMPNNGKKHK